MNTGIAPCLSFLRVHLLILAMLGLGCARRLSLGAALSLWRTALRGFSCCGAQAVGSKGVSSSSAQAQ